MEIERDIERCMSRGRASQPGRLRLRLCSAIGRRNGRDTGARKQRKWKTHTQRENPRAIEKNVDANDQKQIHNRSRAAEATQSVYFFINCLIAAKKN
jgi:hypothetical protein